MKILTGDIRDCLAEWPRGEDEMTLGKTHYIYLGRAVKRYGLPASPLANPYRVGKNVSAERVVQAYASRLQSYLTTRQGIAWTEIVRLQALTGTGATLVLLCWCPESAPCHRDVVRAAIQGWL